MSAEKVVLKRYMEQRRMLLERIGLVRPMSLTSRPYTGGDGEQAVREANHRILVGEVDKIDHLVMAILQPGVTIEGLREPVVFTDAEKDAAKGLAEEQG